MISKETKMQCIELKEQGMKVREIYEEYFLEQTESEMTYSSFRRKLNYWRKQGIHEEGMIKGFKPTWGTVHYDGNGNIIEEWPRGSNGKDWHEEVLEGIRKCEAIGKAGGFRPPHTNLIYLSDHMLEIPLFDLHMGIADFEHYRRTQAEIFEIIVSKRWARIIFAVGSDLFHNNDHRGRTAKGTPIEQVDMEQAFEDAAMLYLPLIELAEEYADAVQVLYIKGNHDETPSWYFVKWLEAKCPDVEFDLTFEEKKVVTWEKIFIGYTHGDKAEKAIPEVFVTEWAMEWAQAKVREIHKGHFHVLKEKDSYGTRVRTLPTGGKTDQYSRDNGFQGAVKEFNLFEYSPDRLRHVHSVYSGKETA